jgi:hypothetical protein
MIQSKRGDFMKKDIKRTVFILFIINGSLLLISLIYVVLFSLDKIFIVGDRCSFQSLFGIYCPGCGGSRSLAALFKFDILSSLSFYPPILISIFTIIYYDVRLVLSFFFDLKQSKYWLFLLIPISIILNFIIRNVLLLVFEIDTVGDFINLHV